MSLGGHSHGENPLTSDAWQELHLGPVYEVRIDQCSLGLKCPKSQKPVLKPTRIVTSCRGLAESLEKRRCPGCISHAHLEGKFKGTNLTAFAETYPYKFCKVVTEALLRACDEQPVRAMDVLAAEVESDSEPADDEADSSQEGDPDQPDQPDQPEAEIRVPSRDKALVSKLHVNTGHSSVEQMLRLAHRCKASDSIVQAIRDFKCSVCEELKIPPSRRTATISHTDVPNEIVGLDMVQVELKRENSSGEMVEIKFNVLTCVDLATDFCQQVIVPPGPSQAAKAFHQAWIRPYGAPKSVYVDPDGNWLSNDFQGYLEHNTIALLSTATESHWQIGRVELANRILRNMARRVWRTTSRPPEETIESCCTARNEQLRKCGFSPSQWFLGRESRHAGLLSDLGEQQNLASQSQVLADATFAAKVHLREQAALAFHEEHAKSIWRRALLAKSRPMRGPYITGQMVYFFRRRARGLLSTRHGVWLGPGKIIGAETLSGGPIPRVIWVSYNGCLYRCSPESLRPIPQDEAEFRALSKSLDSGSLDPELESARQLLSGPGGQFQDLTQDVPGDEDFQLNPEEDELQDVESSRQVRRRITRDGNYWEQRAAEGNRGSRYREGGDTPLPMQIEHDRGSKHPIENQPSEPPASRRRLFEPIPEGDEEEEYTPSVIPPDEQPNQSARDE